MIVSPDARGQIDPTVQRNLLRHLPELSIPIVPISWFPDFQFKPPNVEKYVLLDFMEPHGEAPEYDKFEGWVRDNPPALTFRRELLESDRSPVVLPVEFPCYLDPPEPSGRVQWAARTLDCLFWWGHSSVYRPQLHGDIFARGLAREGIAVTDNWDDDRGNWMSVYAPHWRRKPMTDILPIMSRAKITVALWGNGKKTFRHAECLDTIMALQHDDLAWAYPWYSGVNCVKLDAGSEYDDLRAHLQRPEDELYEIYRGCCENMKKYHAPTYAGDYVAAKIREVL